MVEGEEVGMSEPTNVLRVWMRFALALALVIGTIAGSIVPALALDETTVVEQPANQGSDGAPAPEVVEAPAPEVVEAPAPEVVEAPAPEVVEAPAPEVVEAPAP